MALSDVQVDIVPFDLANPDSWNVPSQTVFAVRIFSPWEASKLTLFTDQGFETLQLPAPDSKLSASDIRLSLIANDNNWQSLVAPSAIETIQAKWDRITSTKVSA
jgi:nicotinamide mononucleotide adenylyltransferase